MNYTQGELVTNELLNALGLTQGDHVALFNFLVQAQSDLDEFMDIFYTGDILRDVMKYQQHKRTVNEMPFEEFEVACKLDTRKAIESLLKEPIASHQVKYLDVYGVTHTELYNRYKNNSNSSYLVLVKGSTETIKDYSDDFLLTT